MKPMILSLALLSCFSVACGGGGDAVTVAEPVASAVAPAAVAPASVDEAAASTGKSAEAPPASTGKSAGPPAGGMPPGGAVPAGAFAVGATVSCNWQNLGMYFSATIERMNGDNISVLYSDGDREDTTISKCRLGAEGSIDGDINAAMEEVAEEWEAAMEEIGEDWAEEFEDELEDAMEELNAAFEDLDF